MFGAWGCVYAAGGEEGGKKDKWAAKAGISIFLG